MATRPSSSGDRDPTRLAVIVLAAAAVAIVVVGFGLVRSVGLFGLNDPAREVVFPELEAKLERIARVTIAGADARVTLRRTQDGWAVEQKDNYPAQASRVDALLGEFARMPALKRKTPPESEYDALGVAAGAENATRVVLADGDGTALARFFVGAEKAAPGAEDLRAYHVRAADADTVWLADANLDLPADPMAWIDAEVLAIDRARLHAVKTAPDEGEPVHIRRKNPREARFSGVNLGDVDLEGKWVLGELVVPFKELRFTDVAKAESPLSPGESGQGFVSTFDGVKIHFDLSERSDGVWARFAATTIEPVVAAAGSEGQGGDGADTAAARTPAERVADLNARLKAWRFRLPQFQVERMRRSVADLPRKGVRTEEGGNGG